MEATGLVELICDGFGGGGIMCCVCCVCVVYQDTEKRAGHEAMGRAGQSRAEADGGDKKWVEAAVMCWAGHQLPALW